MRWFPGILALAAGAAIMLGVVTTTGDPLETGKARPVPGSSVAEVDTAFRLAGSWTVAPTEPVAAGILPHHALVSPIIAAWFTGLEHQPAPSTVVIVGPDHRNAGAGYITTAIMDWQTPDGMARVNTDLAQALVDSGDAILDANLHRHEHGVYTAIPYLRHVWPETRVVTIAIKGDLRSDRLERLADRLDELLNEIDVVIATVDFSHYQSAVDALTEDRRSLAVIRHGDAEGALRIPVDSPPAISLILRYAKIRQLEYQQLAHTTSAEFTGQLNADSTTSYLSAYFVEKK